MECRVAPEVWAYVPPQDRKVIHNALWDIAAFLTQAQADHFRIGQEIDEQTKTPAEESPAPLQAISEAETSTEASPQKKKRPRSNTSASK